MATLEKNVSNNAAKKAQASAAPLNEQAMLVHLEITSWRASKKDQKANAHVQSEFHVADKVSSVWKRLVDKSAVNKVLTIGQNARMEHYRLTLPWENEGSRLLPSSLYAEYRQTMAEHQRKFFAAMEDLLSDYPRLIEAAAGLLGELFNLSDYPTAEALRSKFGFRSTISNVPNAHDFRVSIGDAEKQAIMADMQRRQQEWFADTSKHLWERLYNVVKGLFEQLEKDGIVRQACLDNIRDVCNLLGELNVGRDPVLDKARKEIEAKLCSVSADELSLKGGGNKAARKEHLEKAKTVLKAVGQYL